MTLAGAGEPVRDKRVPVLYLAPWVDLGGSDKGTIDWFRWLDRDRFAPSLITTQPSPNRRLAEVHPYAEEVWALPDSMPGSEFPQFIFDFLHTRRIRVLHIMNSRLGFDLLPDLGCLENPPAVVVQLHVEEPDRSGYVRYVTTRYGNLVDAFSVSSHHLATAMEAYDVPRNRMRVIPTGVDAAQEFNPRRVTPRHFGNSAAVRVMFAGRLVDQKDPLLMIEVVRRLVALRDEVHVDVVGEGPLEHELKRLCTQYGIERHVTLHGPTSDLAPWLAATDALLMTSVFEGVPYVAYEALAMEVPVIAPALPGTVELLAAGGGELIDPRDDADAYVSALVRLLDDGSARREVGEAGRARMVEHFSLRGMTAAHEKLYDELLERVPRVDQAFAAPVAEQMRFPSRPIGATPLVSIVTPCFDHGRYLPDLVKSVRDQDYPAIELIIVDDGSTDADTIDVLDQLERKEGVRVLRQPENRGPSAARNQAIKTAAGRYILPVDADNVLMPGAVRALVEQLQAAGEHIGFIYPAVQYFGNRNYRFLPPSYNLHRLLDGNFIDTCSLFDREIFDAGLRFAEDIVLGHEDWDFALALAARGAVGEPSRGTILRYRKHGFTRSDRVEYLRMPFRQEIQGRHPELYGLPQDTGAFGRYAGPGVRVKARWSPALTLIVSEPLDLDSERGAELLSRLERQTCGDLEVVVETPSVPSPSGGVVRRLPPGLAITAAERVQEGLEISRGRYLLIARAPEDLLADPALVERLIRALVLDPELMCVAFADAADVGGIFPAAIMAQLPLGSAAHALVWRRELNQELGRVSVPADDVVAALARRLHRRVPAMQWWHAPTRSRSASAPRDGGPRRPVWATVDSLKRPPATAATEADRFEERERLAAPPAVPTMSGGWVTRWRGDSWMPPETLPLVRHVRDDGRRMITNDRTPPPGWRHELNLGSIQHFSPPGTVRLVLRAGRYVTVPRGAPSLDRDQPYGHLELAPLPLLIGIERATLPDGNQTLVVADERDHLRSTAVDREFLGYIESFPIEPRRSPRRTTRPERVLVRRVDRRRRHHVYEAVDPASALRAVGPIAAELGRVLTAPDSENAIPVWISPEGFVRTDRYHVDQPSPHLRDVARWVAAPMTWRHLGMVRGRARSSVRRFVDGAVVMRGAAAAMGDQQPSYGGDSGALSGREPRPEPVGYLSAEREDGMAALYSARHPVVRDQFLTHHAVEATDMGYVDVTLLGYLDADAPLTGRTGSQRIGIPWVSRFGLAARYSWDDRR